MLSVANDLSTRAPIALEVDVGNQLGSNQVVGRDLVPFYRAGFAEFAATVYGVEIGWEWRSIHVLTRAPLCSNLTIFPQNAPTAEGDGGYAGDLNPFEDVEVDILVMGFRDHASKVNGFLAKCWHSTW